MTLLLTVGRLRHRCQRHVFQVCPLYATRVRATPLHHPILVAIVPGVVFKNGINFISRQRRGLSSASARTGTAAARTLLESFRLRVSNLFQRRIWKRLAIIVRYTRIPFLVFSVYSLGYQQGIVDCTKTPLALRSQLLNSILFSMGMKTIDKTTVQVIQETMFTPRMLMKSQHAQIAHIGHKIVCAARELVQEELDAALRVTASSLPPDSTMEQVQIHVQQDPAVQFWRSARERLVGEELSNVAWQYIVVETPSPNAFVTEILPRAFFITTSLLKVATTPDELAVILGHEISHLILGHVSDTNRMETILRSLEILLLSLDPTSGVLSLAFMGGLAWTRRMLSARHSRDHEYEADDLGLALAARACFDTRKGSNVMRKMNELNVSLEPEMQSTAVKLGQELLATHPPSLERFERMQQRALEENFEKYRNCSKMSISNSIWKSEAR